MHTSQWSKVITGLYFGPKTKFSGLKKGSLAIRESRVFSMKQPGRWCRKFRMVEIDNRTGKRHTILPFSLFSRKNQWGHPLKVGSREKTPHFLKKNLLFD